MEAKEEEFRVARDAWEGVTGRGKRDAWKALAREREMKEHEMKLLVEQVESSNAARVSLRTNPFAIEPGANARSPYPYSSEPRSKS